MNTEEDRMSDTGFDLLTATMTLAGFLKSVDAEPEGHVLDKQLNSVDLWFGNARDYLRALSFITRLVNDLRMPAAVYDRGYEMWWTITVEWTR
jgi:hypothetical protein